MIADQAKQGSRQSGQPKQDTRVKAGGESRRQLQRQITKCAHKDTGRSGDTEKMQKKEQMKFKNQTDVQSP